jgi:hypothetical protein
MGKRIRCKHLVVEKVKKRELSYKKRWGKGAESEAVDFKIVL